MGTGEYPPGGVNVAEAEKTLREVMENPFAAPVRDRHLEALAALDVLVEERDGARLALESNAPLILNLMEERKRLEAAIQSAMRECERASDVRANRTGIIGNVHLILQEALSAAPVAATEEET